MSENKQIYRCSHCGLIVEVIHGGANPVCCGEPMTLLKENTTDGAKEKHVPVVEKCESCGGVVVKVGSVPHPMEEDHYIEFIELDFGDMVVRKQLKPGDKPEAKFTVPAKEGMVVREYCNKHGLWKA